MEECYNSCFHHWRSRCIGDLCKAWVKNWKIHMVGDWSHFWERKVGGRLRHLSHLSIPLKQILENPWFACISTSISPLYLWKYFIKLRLTLWSTLNLFALQIFTLIVHQPPGTFMTPRKIMLVYIKFLTNIWLFLSVAPITFSSLPIIGVYGPKQLSGDGSTFLLLSHKIYVCSHFNIRSICLSG